MGGEVAHAARPVQQLNHTRKAREISRAPCYCFTHFQGCSG